MSGVCMDKAVLISIRPEWCEKILSGEKTIEIRKTRPKLETPFKCYIYCTKARKGWVNLGTGEQLDGRVVAEFICNYIERFDVPYPAYQSKMRKDILERSCVGYYPMHRYAYHDDLYAWDISDLKVYEKPKELRKFHASLIDHKHYHPPFQRAPQSWCYVEKLEVDE